MIIAELFGRLIRVYLERKAHEAEEEFLNRRMTLADFNRMDVDKNGSVTYDEFIKFFLVTMGKVKEDEMDRMKELYDSFDVNNDGTLQVDDLVMMAKGKNDGNIGSILEF
jgi:Ca2+-binding EF-hand superfamily protein